MSGLFSNYLRQQRFKAIAPYIKGDILDLDCGLANILSYLPSDQVYVGIEKHPDMFGWLLENRKGKGYEFHQKNLDQDVLTLNWRFDTILMLAVVEHMKYPQNILCQIPGLLKPGGRILITTPSQFGDGIHSIGAKAGLFSKHAAEEHETIFSLETLQSLLNENGLTVDTYRKFLWGGNQLFVCSAQIR